MVTKLVGRVKMRKCIRAIYEHMHSRILCLEDKINIQVRISCTQGKTIGSVGNLGLPIFIIGRAMQSQVSKKWWMSSINGVPF